MRLETNSPDLRRWFSETFAPTNHMTACARQQFISVVNWLRKIFRRKPRVEDLRAEKLRLFDEALFEMGLSSTRRKTLRMRFASLWRYAAEQGETVPYTAPPIRTGRKFGPEKLPIPLGGPGTLACFFLDVYQPQALQGTSPLTTGNYFTTLRTLQVWLDRPAKLDELTAGFLADYTGHLAARGLGPATIDRHRQSVLALWRLAHQLGQAPPMPSVRKLVIPRNRPDAWTLEEVGRIVEAAARLDRPRIFGIPATDYWPALLLVAFYTGLRRGSLFLLEPGELDSATGWLTVPGAKLKTRRGQRFRLGRDALEAVRAIYDRDRERLFPARHPLYNNTWLDQDFKAILAGADVEESKHPLGHFHKLRRTCVTWIAAKAGVTAAAELVGHSDRHVQDRYLDERYVGSHDVTAILPRVRAGWLPAPTQVAG